MNWLIESIKFDLSLKSACNIKLKSIGRVVHAL